MQQHAEVIEHKEKIRNATKVSAYGINFDSKLELYTYEALMKAGIAAEYQPKRFEVFPAFNCPGALSFEGDLVSKKNKSKKVHSTTQGEFKTSPKVKPVTYTPDFVGEDFIIECKGHPNESFPLRCKMFKYVIKDTDYRYYIVKNQKQVDIMINHIKKIQNGKQEVS